MEEEKYYTKSDHDRAREELELERLRAEIELWKVEAGRKRKETDLIEAQKREVYSRFVDEDEVQEKGEPVPPDCTVAVFNGGTHVIVVDDGCYVVRVWDGKEWQIAPWLSRSAVKELRQLPENPDIAVDI